MPGEGRTSPGLRQLNDWWGHPQETGDGGAAGGRQSAVRRRVETPGSAPGFEAFKRSSAGAAPFRRLRGTPPNRTGDCNTDWLTRRSDSLGSATRRLPQSFSIGQTLRTGPAPGAEIERRTAPGFVLPSFHSRRV